MLEPLLDCEKEGFAGRALQTSGQLTGAGLS